jgi:DNA-binding transcriptional ArsR family regulator
MIYTRSIMKDTSSPGPRAAAPPARTGALARVARDLQPHCHEAIGVLRALANEKRLLILCHLVPAPLSVSELNARVPLSQSALSQHLAVLRNAGMVRTRRRSQTVYYSLATGIVTRLLAVLHDEFCGR